MSAPTLVPVNDETPSMPSRVAIMEAMWYSRNALINQCRMQQSHPIAPEAFCETVSLLVNAFKSAIDLWNATAGSSKRKLQMEYWY